MLVLVLTTCPVSLRGDLSKWLLEIDTGVYVGKTTSRIRDKLWIRVCKNLKSGRALMVFDAKNEQGMDFRIHNTLWIPINFDGLKLLLRPSQKSEDSCIQNQQHPQPLKNKKIVVEKTKD